MCLWVGSVLVCSDPVGALLVGRLPNQSFVDIVSIRGLVVESTSCSAPVVQRRGTILKAEHYGATS